MQVACWQSQREVPTGIPTRQLHQSFLFVPSWCMIRVLNSALVVSIPEGQVLLQGSMQGAAAGQKDELGR